MNMPNESVFRKSCVPHWGWWLAWTAFALVLGAIVFGVRVARQRNTLAALSARGGHIYSDPAWWMKRIGLDDGDPLTAALSSSFSLGADSIYTDEGGEPFTD